MTVAELMQRLMEFPPDTPVVTRGFDESDLDDVENVTAARVVFRPDQERGHVGQHRPAQDGEAGTLAVFIDR